MKDTQETPVAAPPSETVTAAAGGNGEPKTATKTPKPATSGEAAPSVTAPVAPSVATQPAAPGSDGAAPASQAAPAAPAVVVESPRPAEALSASAAEISAAQPPTTQADRQQQNRQRDGRGGGRDRGRDRGGRDRRNRGGERGGEVAEREPRERRPEGPPVDKVGILDVLPDGFGFLRTNGFTQGDDDVYVSLSQIRRFGLRRGDEIAGQVREPKDNEKYNALLKVDTVNGVDPDTARQRPQFEKLTPLFPEERLRLETPEHDTAARIMDLLCPIGKGQRGLIVSPPKAGKTTILKKLANSITANNPDVELIVLLVDERPEEVTDMQRSVNGDGRGQHLRPAVREPRPGHRARARPRQAPGRDRQGRRRAARLDHPHGARLQPEHAGLGPHPLGRRRLDGALPAQEVLRRGPQHRVRRLADDPRHGAGRHRLAHGRGHLRGVQGHRQHGDPPRPQAGRQAHLPGDRHRR